MPSLFLAGCCCWVRWEVFFQVPNGGCGMKGEFFWSFASFCLITRSETCASPWSCNWCLGINIGVCVTQLCSCSWPSPLDAAFPPQTDAVECQGESGAMSQWRGAPQNGVAPLSVPPAHGVGVDALAVTGCGFIKGVMQMGGTPSAIPGDGTSGLAPTACGMLTAGKLQALERVNHLHGQITLQGGRKGSSEGALQLVRVEIGGLAVPPRLTGAA